MVEKFEVGKSYKCTDMGTLELPNEFGLPNYFDKNDVVFVDGMIVYPDKGNGTNLLVRSDVFGVASYMLVHEDELVLFEEVAEETVEETPTFTEGDTVEYTRKEECVYHSTFSDGNHIVHRLDGQLVVVGKDTIKKK